MGSKRPQSPPDDEASIRPVTAPPPPKIVECGNPYPLNQEWALKASPVASPAERIMAAKELVERIVCTEGEDKGVVMLSQEGPCTFDEDLQCYVYLHEYFSPLGDALIELWDLLKEQD